jgi:hypothetical protein
MTDKPDGKPKSGYWVLRRIGVAFAALYPVFVATLATIKLITPQRMSWPEVFYGPAITLVSVWMLVAIGAWIAERFWRR